jgi:hypothetical protein
LSVTGSERLSAPDRIITTKEGTAMMDRARVQQQGKTTVSVSTDTATEVSKVGVITIAAFAALVGLWSAACIIGGMAASGGPLAFVGAWFKAVTGM